MKKKEQPRESFEKYEISEPFKNPHAISRVLFRNENVTERKVKAYFNQECELQTHNEETVKKTSYQFKMQTNLAD